MIAHADLGDVVSYIRGITFKPDDKIEPSADGAVVCMRTSNVQRELDESDLIAVPQSFVRRPELFLKRGDILVSSANSWNLVGKCCFVPELDYSATAGGFISIVRAKDDVIDQRYLYRWLSSEQVQQAIRHLGRQTTNISNLPVDQFLGLEIPLPPLPEQKRIAAILDKADSIRRKRQQAIELADQFLRSVFLDLFGDPVTNPKGLDKDQLGNLIKVASGKGLTASQMHKSGTFAVYGGNGINGRHSEFMFREPEIVIGRVGVYCGVVHITEPNSWVTDNALYIKEYLQRLDKDYLAEALKIAKLNQYAGQAAQPLVSGGRIYPVEILVPPPELVEQFAKAKTKIMGIARTLGGANSKVEELFGAVSQRAFAGTL